MSLAVFETEKAEHSSKIGNVGAEVGTEVGAVGKEVGTDVGTWH